MACVDTNQENVPQFDSSILSSFLDDSPLECCDDERLRIVIQSLEAAMNPVSMNDQEENCVVFDEEQMYSPESFAAEHLDSSWMDVEIMSPSSTSSSSPNDDISWYDQVSGDELDISYMTEYGEVNRYYSEIPMEMEKHIYISLWQETYDLHGLETCTFN